MSEKKRMIELIRDTKEEIEEFKNNNKGLVIELIGSSLEKSEIKNEFGSSCFFTGIKAGDFWIRYNGKLLFLFERKTYADLSASIKDGRHKSQKFKIKRMPIASNRCHYLIEDPMDYDDLIESKKGKYMLNTKVLLGAEMNAIIRDGFGETFRTLSMTETVLKLLTRVKKLYEFPGVFDEELKKYPTIVDDFDPLTDDTQVGEGERKEERKEQLEEKKTGEKRKSKKKEKKEESSSEEETDTGGEEESSSEEDEKEEKEEKKDDSAKTEAVRSYVKSKKKTSATGGVINAQSWYFSNLANITRMGQNEKTITAKFPKYGNLIKFCYDTKLSKTEKIKRLTDLSPLTTNMNSMSMNGTTTEKKKGSRKRLGPVLAKRLYDWLTDE
jgi:hypothetical protein